MPILLQYPTAPIQRVHPILSAAFPGAYNSVPAIDDTRAQIFHQLGKGSIVDAAEGLGGNSRKLEKSEPCPKTPV